MDLILIILELVTLLLMVLFCGVLENTRYHKKVRFLKKALWLPVVLLFIIMYPTNDNEELKLTWVHIAYNAVLLMMFFAAFIKFRKVSFQMTRSYLSARAALYWGMVLEFAAGALLVHCLN